MEQYRFMNIKVCTYNIDDNWNVFKINAHPFGVLTATWAITDQVLRFITAGVDGFIKIWSSKQNEFGSSINSIGLELELKGHEDVVRDIVWKYYPDTKDEIIISGGDVKDI
jgi:WD40 repeat protein